MSMINLLLLTNRFPASEDDGASPFVADFVAGLERNDINCTVVTPYHHAEKFNYPEVVRFGWKEERHPIGSLPLYSPLTWHKIYSYFKSGYREVIHQHKLKRFDFCLALWAAPSGLFARRLKREFGVPYAVWCLGSDIHTYAELPLVGKMIIDTLRRSDRVYSDGHQLGKRVEELSKCRYHFLPSLRKVRFNVPAQDARRERLFICPGRIEKAKGVFDLLEAFRQQSDLLQSWSLYFIGTGKAQADLQNKVNQYHLGDQVRLLGFLPAQEMFRLITLSGAVIIPTRIDTLPLTFGEAMQLQRPVIVTDVGDLRHFTEKYGVGEVARPNSPESLAEAILRFLNRSAEYNSRYAECVQELDIDLAADKFARWLNNHLSHRAEKVLEMVC